MILYQFPDLQWLKRQAEQSFSDRKGWGGRILTQQGWPTVILNAQTKYTVRDDIPGPLSIFTNISGASNVSVDKKRVVVRDDFFFLSNHGQRYTLEIDGDSPTQTFNIHFGEHFADEVLQSLKSPSHLLDNTFLKSTQRMEFHNRLQPHDARTKQILQTIRQHGESNPMLLEEMLADLLTIILRCDSQVKKIVDRLPVIKQSTRQEILQRMLNVTDYIYAFYDQSLSLEELAAASCLSKFHFLRLFKIAFGKTPHQFINDVRICRAQELLTHASLDVHEVAARVGFQNSSSFSRSFFQRTGMYPTLFKKTRSRLSA